MSHGKVPDVEDGSDDGEEEDGKEGGKKGWEMTLEGIEEEEES